jgi:hypothetical protein
VRETYGRVVFAAQVGLVAHAAVLHSPGWPGLDDEPALKDALSSQIRFRLDGFQVDKVERLKDVKWSSLVTTFPEANLRLSYQDIPIHITGAYSTVAHLRYADVSWDNAAAPRGLDDAHEPTLGDVIAAMRKGKAWSTVASFDVTAALRGRSITYRALFLFGDDGNGKEMVLPIDYVSQTGLSSFVASPAYPAALLETAFRDVPFVKTWIKDNEVIGCKKKDQPEVCCEPATGRCGLSSEDIERSSRVKTDPDTGWISRTTKGQH